MMESTPPINDKSSTPLPKPPQGMSRPAMDALEGTDLQKSSIDSSSAQIDKVLRQLSELNGNIQVPFTPGKQREITKASFSEGVKAARKVLRHTAHNEQMKSTVGKHRQNSQ